MIMDVLKELKRKQQLKVEELKKKTSYYMTKGLIERYETPPKQRKTSTPAQGLKQEPSRIRSSSEIVVKPNQPNQLMLNHNNTQNLMQNQNRIQNHMQNQNHLPNTYNQPTPHQEPKTWVDKLMDVVIGDEDGAQNKFALICEKCFTHNGLVLREDYVNARFKCMSCGHLTDKSLSRMNQMNMRLNSGTPSMLHQNSTPMRSDNQPQTPSTNLQRRGSITGNVMLVNQSESPLTPSPLPKSSISDELPMDEGEENEGEKGNEAEQVIESEEQ
jgi:hypothetical protein